ncbi:MAG: polymer-forming cytoskeletal protein [Elioraea sp.]|nr:polymer-forming cytoskeletal protein [Elioraea sp.]
MDAEVISFSAIRENLTEISLPATMRACGAVEISGPALVKVEGEIEGGLLLDEAQAVAVIAPGATVRRVLRAATVIVAGTVDGDVSAKRVEVRASGRVKGAIECDAVLVHEGGAAEMGVRIRRG